MEKHEFGIMQNSPTEREDFVTYEPKKYGCIPVPDSVLLPVLENLYTLDTFWHSVTRPEKNLAYTGITLIPPTSLGVFLNALENVEGTENLTRLLQKAQAEEKFVIHYGL